MIKEKTITVSISNRTKNRYKKLGYDIEGKTEIEISPFHLTDSSHIKITAICEKCGKETVITYDKYTNNVKRQGYYGCKACSRSKYKETCIKEFGVDNSMKNKEVQEKGKQTKKERYGDENYNNMDKHRETCLEKYGKEDILSVPEIIEKGNKTKLEKYGDEHYTNVEKRIKTKRDNLLIRFKEWYPNLDIIRVTEDRTFIIFCPICKKEYEITPKNVYNRHNYKVETCVLCNPLKKGFSGNELNLYTYINSIFNGEVEMSNRTVLEGRKELDVYIPSKKLAFEFNGVYWHNELYKDKNYHLNKTKECLEKGIQLIHIFEDDWRDKQEIVKSRINNLLGLNNNIIYGRKCEIKKITDNELVKCFLECNHIQGFCQSSLKLGLYHENELVSIMTFGKQRMFMGQKAKEDSFELLRFCNKLDTSVIGGASKLFKCFTKNKEFNEIVSYADRSWSKGGLYEQLGFEKESEGVPGYSYVVNKTRENRFKYRKDALVKEGYDESMSEHDIMISRKIYRIYNAGSLKYSYKNINK